MSLSSLPKTVFDPRPMKLISLTLMYRVIFFDLGNVILPFDPQGLSKRLARHSDYPAEKILGLLWHPELGASLEKGEITPQEFFTQVKASCHLKMSYEEFMVEFNDIFREDGAVVELLSKLKPSYSIGLISNTNIAHMNHVKNKFTFFAYIDEMILSHEVGLRKPDPEIFRHALHRLKVPPHQSIFIDDMAENIQAAHALGMKAIQFLSAEALTEHLIQLGVMSQGEFCAKAEKRAPSVDGAPEKPEWLIQS